MPVRIIRFSPAVNDSERIAEARCKSALESLGDAGNWIVFAGFSSASSPVHQADDLDLVLIGPRGVFPVEVKHWSATWIGSHSMAVDVEADKITAKAKRLAGRVKRILSDPPRVSQSFLVTDEGGSGAYPKAIKGVPVWTLRDLHKVLQDFPGGALTGTQIEMLAEGLEPIRVRLSRNTLTDSELNQKKVRIMY